MNTKRLGKRQRAALKWLGGRPHMRRWRAAHTRPDEVKVDALWSLARRGLAMYDRGYWSITPAGLVALDADRALDEEVTP